MLRQVRTRTISLGVSVALGWKVARARIGGGTNVNWIPPGLTIEVIYHQQRPAAAEDLIQVPENVGLHVETTWSEGKADPGIVLIEFRVGQWAPY